MHSRPRHLQKYGATAETKAASASGADTEATFDAAADRHKGQYALRKLYHETSRPLIVLYTGALRGAAAGLRAWCAGREAPAARCCPHPAHTRRLRRPALLPACSAHVRALPHAEADPGQGGG